MAFQGCTGIKGDLTIGYLDIDARSSSDSRPTRVEATIGELAFQGCTGFTGNLTIGRNVTVIGNNAFTGCNGFTGRLTIGSTDVNYQPNTNYTKEVTIGDFAFAGCVNFTGDLTITRNVKSIGNHAFDGFAYSGGQGRLGTLYINMETVPILGFSPIPSTNIVFGDNVRNIESWALGPCPFITNDVVFPQNVTSFSSNIITYLPSSINIIIKHNQGDVDVPSDAFPSDATIKYEP